MAKSPTRSRATPKDGAMARLMGAMARGASAWADILFAVGKMQRAPVPDDQRH